MQRLGSWMGFRTRLRVAPRRGPNRFLGLLAFPHIFCRSDLPRLRCATAWLGNPQALYGAGFCRAGGIPGF